MFRRAFLQWVSAASVAAAVAFPQFGLQAQELSGDALQPNERVQKIVLSPVLEALEEENLARCAAGGVVHDYASPSHGIPVYSETTGRLIGYAPLVKRSGKAYAIKSRRELMFAWGGVEKGDA